MSNIHNVTVTGGAITVPNIDVALSTRLKPADTLAAVTTVGTITNAVTINSVPTGSNTIGKVKITDGTYDAEVDGLGYLVGIDIAHHKIHESKRYAIRHFGTGKNDGDSISVYFKTPNTTKRLHAYFDYSGSGAAWGFIYEAPTVTVNTGTNNQVMFNRDRNSSNSSTVIDNATVPNAGKYGINVTITNVGTIIYTDYSGAGKQHGAQSRGDDEFILKANTVYCFVVESDAAGLTLNEIVDFYET
jgi:hypothetical protein